MHKSEGEQCLVTTACYCRAWIVSAKTQFQFLEEIRERGRDKIRTRNAKARTQTDRQRKRRGVIILHTVGDR